MGRTRPPYSEEFRREAVELARLSPERSVPQIASALGVSDQSLRNWIRKAELDRGAREGQPGAWVTHATAEGLEADRAEPGAPPPAGADATATAAEPIAGTAPAASEAQRYPAESLPPAPLPWYRPIVDWRRVFLLGGGAVVIALIGAGAALGVSALLGDSNESAAPAPAPAPSVVIEPGLEPEEPEELGFPSFATQNTTRIGGADPVADAAGVALATYPSTGGVEGPAAVSIVGSSDWQGAVAAASLAAAPIGAPILVSEAGGVPALTLEAIRGLAPRGSSATGGAQVFRIGAPSVPEGLQVSEIEAADPAEAAANLDRVRGRLTGGEVRQVLIVSADAPEFAVPAAAWAARAGDPVLFVEPDSVPDATLRALRRHKGAQAYVLGPERIVSDRVLARVERTVAGAQRISGGNPVTNAIAFARFADGEFGWDINDPGHGFVIANASRPVDAAVAAPLSATAKPGPLLLTDDAEVVPDPLRAFLLDTKPGYVDDPTRAVYNHVWLIGDREAIGLGFQAQVDELTELARVTGGAGAPGAPRGAGAAESEPQAG